MPKLCFALSSIANTNSTQKMKITKKNSQCPNPDCTNSADGKCYITAFH